MKKHSKILCLALSLIMMLSLVPSTVFATGETYPSHVTVNNGVQLSGAAFFKNGDTEGNLTGNATDYNAKYDSATGVLELNNYQGGTIATTGNTGKTTTIKISGANAITDARNGIFAAGGDSVVITSDENATLNITINGIDTYSGTLAGVCAYNYGIPHGSVTVKGNVNLVVNVTTASTNAFESAVGIYAAKGITIEDNAAVTVKCKNTTNGSTNNIGLFTENGSNQKITFNTTGNILVDVSETNGYSFAVRSSNYGMTKAGLVTLKWNPGVANTGGKLYGGDDAFNASNWAINIDNTNHVATYKYGTPYTVNVFCGRANMSNGKYVEDETVTLTAHQSYVGKFGFKKWASDDITIADATNATASFAMPAQNVSVIAYYNIFTTEPKFERLSDNSGKITYVLKEAPSQVKWCKTNGEQVDTFGNSVNGDHGIGTFKTPAGTYYIEFTIDGGVYRSEPIAVDYSAGTHSHSWAMTWSTDGTHHWHECTASGCDITDNSQKDGYAAHAGGTATCQAKATCSTCNEEYGAINPANHASFYSTIKHDDDYHWAERTCCSQSITSKQAHYYTDDADTTCNFTNCGYVRTITHTCGASTLTPVAKVDATHFTEGKQAYYRCSCGEYYEDATASTKITDISTWGIIEKTPHQLSTWKHDDSNNKHWKECTIESCSYKEKEAAHAGGTATCQEKKTCTECGEKYGEFGAHNYDITTWGYKGADGHAHYCKTTGCTEHDTITAHIPGAAATEEAAQTCTVCGYELAAKLEHAPMLVEGYEATTEAPGKKDYYHCDSCGRNYEDPTSLKEITGDVEEWRYIPMIIAIIEGNGQVWTKGTTVDLTFKSNANFADFTRVEVDGAKVDASNYTKSEGSTIVTLKASFLETLSVGEHTIVIVSANDVPEAKFTVKAAATGGNTGNEQNPDTGVTSPQTGDSSNMFLWIALLFVSLGGLTTTVVYKKRKAVKE